MNVCWRPDSVNTAGINFIRKLSKCLWYLDPHHYNLRSQGIHVPARFSGYYDFKKKKHKLPRISSEDLHFHIQELSGMLMQKWFAVKRFELLRNDIENLVDSLDKYKRYLCEHTEKVKSRQSELSLTSSEENASLITLPGSGGRTSSTCLNLVQKLANVEVYHPVF